MREPALTDDMRHAAAMHRADCAWAKATAMLAGVPCPQWVRDEFDAHQRRRMLVLEIWALSDKSTAFLALWIARAAMVVSRAMPGPNLDVEHGLRAFKSIIMSGGMRR